MTQANKELREAARKAQVPFWAVAKEMGISEPTMTRKLRQELSEAEKQKISWIIERLKEVKQDAAEQHPDA